ncbi:MAG: DUF72 domain-containing protein [Bacteroidota bacterium]
MSELRRYYSGTSGLLLPVPNKLHYPEEFKEKSRLCYYGSLANSIEVNSSFYKIPLASTIKKWADDVPQEFKFTFKLFKEITHNKFLAFDPDLIRKFIRVINNAGEKKGCLLVQFPPSVRLSELRQIKALLQYVRENDECNEWNTAVEFRHASLYNDEVYEILDEFKMGMVIHDKSPASTPFINSNTSFEYLRFHGPGGNYRGSYSEYVLSEYASYIQEWLAEDKAVYVYFNNTMGDAIRNKDELKAMITNF